MALLESPGMVEDILTSKLLPPTELEAFEVVCEQSNMACYGRLHGVFAHLYLTSLDETDPSNRLLTFL
jgi:hypothetical protein